MARFTQAEKLSAKSTLDYQTRVLKLAETAWQEKWCSAINPFLALIQWKADKPTRVADTAPWLLAKKRSDLCGSPSK